MKDNFRKLYQKYNQIEKLERIIDAKEDSSLIGKFSCATTMLLSLTFSPLSVVDVLEQGPL